MADNETDNAENPYNEYRAAGNSEEPSVVCNPVMISGIESHYEMREPTLD